MAFRRIIDLDEETATGTHDIVISDGSSGTIYKTALQDVPMSLFKNDEDYFSYSSGHKDFATGISNQEENRIVLQSGEQLVVERLEFRQQGGGSSSSASVRLQDIDAASTLASQQLGGTTKDAGTSNSGNTIEVQVSNSTGSTITGSVTVIGRIIGV